MTRLALIGAGRWGRKLLPVLDKKVTVVAIAHHGGKETEEWLRQNYPHIPVRSLEEIATDTTIQGVIIATPPQSHKEVAELFLANGKAVWIEKPFGASSEEAMAIATLAEKNNQATFVGYVFTYHPAWQKALALFQGKNEKIKEVSLDWQKYGTFTHSIVADLACHHLSLGLIMFPQINAVEVQSNKGNTLSFTASLGGRTVLRSNINRESSGLPMHSVRLIGEMGTVYVIENNDLFEERNSERKRIALTATAIENEVDAFIGLVEKGEKPLTDAAFAIRVWEFINQLTVKSEGRS